MLLAVLGSACRLRGALVASLLLAAAQLATSSCSSSAGSDETGAACSDGKDNDGDGRIDCDDLDCSTSSVCAQADARLDRASLSPDRRALDQPRPGPDQPAASSFGARCTNPQGGCPDGKTTCVPGIASPSGLGYCTYACPSLGDPFTCPAAPAGPRAAGRDADNGQPDCAVDGKVNRPATPGVAASAWRGGRGFAT
jgi:hypothetical protein